MLIFDDGEIKYNESEMDGINECMHIIATMTFNVCNDENLLDFFTRLILSGLVAGAIEDPATDDETAENLKIMILEVNKAIKEVRKYLAQASDKRT